MQNTRIETQILQDAPAEQIAPSRGSHITGSQEVNATAETFNTFQTAFLRGNLMGKAKHQHIGQLFRKQAEDLAVCIGQQEIISIQELNVLTLCQFKPLIPRSRKSLILLADYAYPFYIRNRFLAAVVND